MKRFVWIAALFCIWGGLIYSNTLHAPFVFDDEEYIVRNSKIRNLNDGELIKTEKYRKRFVAFASFALNYHLGGLEVTGYHLFNILIHLANALLIIWLILLIFATPRMRGQPIKEHADLIAMLAALLFLVHPIQTQAVTYISQRFESFATFFFLLSICSYLKTRLNPSRKTLFITVSIAAAFLGLFTKETVFTLPFVILLCEWLFFDLNLNRRFLFRFSFGVSILVFIGLFFFPGIFHDFSRYTSNNLSSLNYFLIELRVILKYLGLWFFPLKQNIDYNFPINIMWPPILIAGTALSALLYLAVHWRKTHTLVSFGLFWFFITLLPTSSIIPMLDVIAEHRLYLPSIGLALACMAGLFVMLEKRRAIAISMLFVLVFSFLTFQRNAVWADELRLWQTAVIQSPKTRTYTHLAEVYQKKKQYENAVLLFLQAIKVSPNPGITKDLYVLLGAVFAEVGDFDKQIYYTKKALEIDPKHAQAYSNLGFAYSMSGKHNEALEYAKEAVRLDPALDATWNNLGIVYANMGQFENAAKTFERTLKVNPYNTKARENLYTALSMMEKKD